MPVTNKAVLAQLNVSQWTARKKDKKQTTKLLDANDASQDAASVHKRLFPKGGLLDQIHQMTTQIRTKFYKNTLPWGLDGTYILPSAIYFDFITEFRRDKAEWQNLVDRFLSHYNAEVQRLNRDHGEHLGSLFNYDDYPTFEQVKEKFNMEMTILPIPTSDFRVEISENEMLKVQQDVEARVEAAHKVASQDIWERLYDRVQKMEETLSNPSKNFKDSLFGNAVEICDLLPKLNYADDPDLEAMRLDVEAKLTKHNPEVMRWDPDLRKKTAAEAKQIMDRMGTFMGGSE